MDLRLPQDFREFFELLNSEKIEYLLVGGYAVAYHGYSRPTGDLDVWVAVHPNNAARLVDVLAKFGFGGAGATPEVFMTPKAVVRMGVPPVKIELLTSVAGVEFSECYARRVDTVLDGVAVAVIGRADLIANKRAAGRPKDINDVEVLEGKRSG